MKKAILVYIIGSLIISGFYSCKSSEKKAPVEVVFSSDSTVDVSCPYFTKDAAGNTVMCWVQGDENDAFMYYSVLENNGSAYSKPFIIFTSKGVHPHSENLAKMIFKKNGEIIAVFGKTNPNPINKYAGLVFYTQSFDNGKSWNNAKPLVTDTSSYDQRYFDMALLPDGEAAIIWLDSRLKEGEDGSTLFFAKTYGKNGFGNEMPVVQSICPCCRTKLFTDSKGNLHASFRDIINDSIRDMVHIMSTDGGKTFSKPKRISADNWKINGCPHSGPTMVQNKNGFHFAWYTLGGGEGVFYCNSKNNCATFTNRESVSKYSSAKHPQITALANGNLVLVWDEVDEKAAKPTHRIGLQIRDSEGKIIKTKIISAAEENASFPVLIPADNEGEIMVAYTVNKKLKQQVICKSINIVNI